MKLHYSYFKPFLNWIYQTTTMYNVKDMYFIGYLINQRLESTFPLYHKFNVVLNYESLLFATLCSTALLKLNINSSSFCIIWFITVNPLNNSLDWWVNACLCKGYSHFSKEHVVLVIGGGESLQVSLQLQQLPLHLPEALFQILCRYWHTHPHISVQTHTHL